MLSPNSPESVAAVAHAEEVAQILKQNVVQGKKEGEDLYSKSFKLELETVS
jgi:complex III assembly factor LYRM7